MSVNKNIFYSFLVQGPTLVLSLFINFFITRTIQAEGRGVYAVFVSDTDLFSLFLGFTITSAVVFFVANKNISLEKIMGLGILVTLIGTAILTVLLVVLYNWKLKSFILPDDYDEPFHYLYLIGCFVVVMLSSIINSVFQGITRFRLVNGVTLFNSLLNFTVFGIAYYLYQFEHVKITVNTILQLTFLMFLTNFLLWLFLYLRHIKVIPVFRFHYTSDIKPLFVFMTIGHLAHMISFLTYRMDFWIVEYYKGSVELGYYAQSAGLAQMFWSITNPIATVLVPYMSAKSDESSRTTFAFFSRLNFTIILGFVLVFFFIAPFFFPIYGADFIRSVIPFQILIFGILMSCVSKIFAVYIYSHNKIHYNLYATIIGFILTIVLDFVLIPKMGIIGASIASTTAYFATAAVTAYFLHYSFRINLKQCFLVSLSDIRIVLTKLRSNFLR